jgi:hypothetical protein
MDNFNTYFSRNLYSQKVIKTPESVYAGILEPCVQVDSNSVRPRVMSYRVDQVEVNPCSINSTDLNFHRLT